MSIDKWREQAKTYGEKSEKIQDGDCRWVP